MKIGHLFQVVIRAISMAAGFTFGIYYTLKSLASVTGDGRVLVAIIGIAIFLVATTLIKEKNKAKRDA